MPTYEYECDKCGKVTSVEQKVTDEPFRFHSADCNGNLKRLLFPVGAVLKGGGWAKDNYSKKESK